jgi:hypothetical protein
MPRNLIEKLFYHGAEDAGLDIQDPPSIKCDKPVADKEGRFRKTKTTPDFSIYDPSTGNSALIEVTNGSGNTPHKRAQQAVVDEAGVDNYYQLTGDQVRGFYNEPTPERKRSFLWALLGWIIP